MRNFIIAALSILFAIISFASQAEENSIFEVETDGSYRMAAESSAELAKSLAFYSAKRKAVDLAGRYLSSKDLIKPYERNRDEIYSLAAREIPAEILEEGRQTIGKMSIYRLRVRSWIRPSDFVKAEIEDYRQEKKEAEES
jgi:hypothetical protein